MFRAVDDTSSTSDCENDKYKNRERWFRAIPRAIRLVSNSVLPEPGGTLITRFSIRPAMTSSIAQAMYSWCQLTENLNPIRGLKNARVKNRCSSSHFMRFALSFTGSIFTLEFIYCLPYLLISSGHRSDVFTLQWATTSACNFFTVGV